MFEIKKSDLAGRIGILHTNHGKIETPAFVPVIHPVKQKIPARKLREMGFDLGYNKCIHHTEEIW